MQPSEGMLTSHPWKKGTFVKDAQFFFDVGSRLVIFSDHAKGTLYKPKPTRNQQFHTDGPLEYAAVWDENSNLILKGDPNRFKDLPVPDPNTCSRSALMAFFSNTCLGTASTTSTSLKVDIPLGCCCLFRFDWLHHGWKCLNPTDSDLASPFALSFAPLNPCRRLLSCAPHTPVSSFALLCAPCACVAVRSLSHPCAQVAVWTCRRQFLLRNCTRRSLFLSRTGSRRGDSGRVY